jgi:hypothetical protein
MRGWLLVEYSTVEIFGALRWKFTPHFIPGPSHWKQAQPVRFSTGCLAPPLRRACQSRSARSRLDSEAKLR